MGSERLEQYKKWLAKEPQLGDKYVIIDAKWLEHWKRFVGLEEKDENEIITDPGPIDFSKLAVLSDDEDPKNIQLRLDAVENNDYTFIPYELYKQLLETQKKVGSEIVREVIPRGDYDTVVESFLVPLRIRQSRNSSASTKQIYRSRRTKISDIKKTICNEFHLSESANGSLFSSTDDKGLYWDTIDEPDYKTLEDIDLVKNAYIVYESRALVVRSANLSKTSYIPGLCGLTNLGNTCFMNSALQCISNVPELTKYFLTNEYSSHINRDNPLGMKGDVAQAYGELIHEMWSGKTSYCAPKSLKHNVARYAPQFSGYAQQDSQEFMSFLLDGLHEDLNLVKKKPYVEKKDDDGTLDDDKLAAQEWSYYQKRNQSKIHDIFHGQIKSVVQCLTCGTKARTFDPICFLSLPLPNKKKIRTYKVDYVRTHGQVKSYYIKANELGRMSDLVAAFCARFQPKKVEARNGTELMETDDESAYPEDNDDEQGDEEDLTKADDYDGHQPKPDYIHPVEVYNHRIHLQYNESHALTRIIDRDQIVFYESEHSLKSDKQTGILMPCTFREVDYRQNFGLPIYLSLPRKNCTGKNIRDALQKVIGNFLPLSSVAPADKPLYSALLQITQNYSPQLKPLSSLLDEQIDFARLNVELVVEVNSAVVDLYKKQEKEKEKADDSQQSAMKKNNRVENSTKRTITLMDCFRYFTKKETLSDDDRWFCPKCKQLEKATKKFDIWLLPKILIVQLKRFSYTRYHRDKIEDLVDCPLHDLDLSQFVLNPEQKKNTKYDLIGVSNHMGSLGGGHYTAYAKNSKDERWHSFDDSYVSDISENDVISRSAYVLIYRQKSTTNEDAN
ncbi:unnamed protein product [Adineta ricciae]|uniref:Ubiquitin carboxyl-terminal hydrolase n=1 Tax=Adineta ricciae TaxID=249248 RepID=A0A814JZK1_ADIRI|nr:unnamed protein product [Adineta ricciae]